MQPKKWDAIRAFGIALMCCGTLGAAHAQAPQPGVSQPSPAQQVAPPAASAPADPAPAASAPASSAPASSVPASSVPAPSAAGGVPSAEQGTPPAMDVAAGLLPRDLTPWGMFMAADIVVKAVMLGLLLASVLTWTIWLAKTLELIGARRRLARAHAVLEAARSFGEAARPASAASPQVGRLVQAVEGELRRAPDFRDIDGIKERIAARFERIEAAVGRQMLRGTGILATIGATAPFVGLFGTVWGIMNSFIGISKLHTTNLAVVAPGIAEALLATAFGLAAAIPAVVIYNMFSRSIAQYRALYADTSVEVMTLVSRDLVQRPERYPAAVPAAE